MVENIFFSAFLMGFLGSTHCMAMCGGIVGALSQQQSMPSLQRKYQSLDIMLTYNTGRIVSYCCIGLLAGIVGSLGFSLLDSAVALFFSRLLTAIFMVSFGFYLLGWPSFLPYLENKGQVIWRLVSPYTSKLLPIRSLYQAFLLGLLWGWLPCGLVYSAVALSLSTFQVTDGALTMLFFGLGTLPALLIMGLASSQLSQFKKSMSVRRIAGVIMICLALMHVFSMGLFSHSLHVGH